MENDPNAETGTPITGAELYALFRRKQNAMGIALDAWEDLDDTDRTAWRILATDLLYRSHP